MEVKKTPRKRTTVKSDIKLWNIKTLKPSYKLGMCVEDIIKKHTLLVKNHKSYYMSRNIKYLKNIILQTVANPDQRRRHQDNRRKSVLLKKYPEQIGMHGFTGRPCHTIVVILLNINNQIITAYPSL